MTVSINGWAYSWDDDRPCRRLNPPVSAERNEYELNRNVADAISNQYKIEIQKGFKTEATKNYRARKRNEKKAELK